MGGEEVEGEKARVEVSEQFFITEEGFFSSIFGSTLSM